PPGGTPGALACATEAARQIGVPAPFSFAAHRLWFVANMTVTEANKLGPVFFNRFSNGPFSTFDNA
ncbi:MAG: hypothetical protein AB1705_10290, partial [Verrucomicrobiota bacterium]